MSRKNPPTEPAASPEPGVVLVPPRSSFDFLEGAFAKSERSRMGGIMLVGVCAVTLAGSVTLGGLSAAAAQMSGDELTSAQVELSTIGGKLAQLDSVDGIPASQIRSHVQQRTAALTDAYGEEIDTVGLMGAVSATAPSGVNVTGVTFSAPEAAKGGTKDKDADDSEDDTTPAAGAASVSVTGTATSFALLTAWQTALEATPGLSEIDMTWTGSADAVQVTVSATVTSDALSARAKALQGSTSEGDQ